MTDVAFIPNELVTLLMPHEKVTSGIDTPHLI